MVSRAVPSTAPTSVTTPSVIATSAVRARRAGAVDDGAALDHEIVHGHRTSPKNASDVVDQQIGFLERGEVTATIEPGVADAG